MTTKRVQGGEKLRTCRRCGVPIDNLHGSRKSCDDCVKIVKVERENKRRREARAEKAKGNVLFCMVCGRKFLSIHGTIFCSEECRKESKKASYRHHGKKFEGRVVPLISLDELARKAMEHGTSYGKLVAREGF